MFIKSSKPIVVESFKIHKCLHKVVESFKIHKCLHKIYLMETLLLDLLRMT